MPDEPTGIPADQTRVTAPIFIGVGAVLEQRYRLDMQVGEGGMGIVYRAHDILLDRDVAVKVLNTLDVNEVARAHLMREARTTAQLRHPNIVSVYDVGTVNTAAPQPAPFIVMELIEGVNLREVEGLTFAQIIGLARQICDALDHAHSAGLVHRDLKPENILVEKRNERYVAKLVDFGLAIVHTATKLEEGIVGTVLYIAPEQIQGNAIDARTDLYSLGVVLYELVTGDVPFVDTNPIRVLSQHLHDPVIPPSQRCPEIPPALESIILQLLAKEPAERFASARELDSALAEIETQRAPIKRTNLPQQLTSFVGRAKAIDKVKYLLTTSRLLTLTGSGGIGKTRLSIQVGALLIDQYADGVFLIELARVTDPALVPQAVAAVLSVREESNHPLIQTVTEHLREKNLLLLLDNCEHLIAACAQFADTVLRVCPDIRILATSREALNIAGETLYRVPSLSLPEIGESDTDPDLVANLLQYESVRLFTERAIAVAPGFALTAHNAPALVRICQRLDGIPLAIELAAARVKALSVEQIAKRLDSQFDLLSLGSRTALPRQQTLRALIDWSYNLLANDERTLFNRLAVFVDGWTMAAAESICGADDIDVMNVLAQLIDKSLVSVGESNDDEARYRLLETIRQYALEKLHQAGDEGKIRERHRDWFLQFTEEAEPNLHGGDQVAWLNQFETDYANILAALDWTIARVEDAQVAMRFGGALWQFWNIRGYWSEGLVRLNKVLEYATALPHTPERAKALIGKGTLSMYQSDYAVAQQSLEEANVIAQEIADQRLVAQAMHGLGRIAQDHGDYAQAIALYQKALEAFRRAKDEWGTAGALLNLGLVELYRARFSEAQSFFSASLAAFRRVGDKRNVGKILNNLGLIEYLNQHYANARVLYEESLAIDRELRDKAGIANKLDNLGYVALHLEDYTNARALLIESIVLAKEMNNRRLIVDALYGIAGAIAALGKAEHAAQIIGAADALLDTLGVQVEASNRDEYDRCIALAREPMDKAAFKSIRAIGRTLTLEQAIEYAREH